MRSKNRSLMLGASLLVIAFIGVPALMSDYRLFQFAMILNISIAVLGLNLLVGYNGQLSLGHGAIYALGAYAAAILIGKFHLPWYLAVIGAPLVCAAFGFAFGWPALRLKGHHLALATFALAIATPQLLKHKALEGWTGGVQGLFVEKPEAPFGLPFSADQWLYFVILAAALAMHLFAWNIVRGRLGRAMVAIKEHPTAAAAMGINVPMTKALTFAVSSLFTGLAGAFGAIAVGFIAPDSFNTFLSIFFLVAVIVGGVRSIAGGVLGAAFIQLVPNVADEISKSASSAIYAVILIAVMFVMPGGLASLFTKLSAVVRMLAPGRPVPSIDASTAAVKAHAREHDAVAANNFQPQSQKAT
ncbi:branched-chain amino acid ABC transporter permease [soil metagenome]